MGRELKRVPLDFDWPLKQVWEGYNPPPARGCPANCEHGSTPAGAWLEKIVHLIMMLPDSANRGKLHPWLEALELRPDQLPDKSIAELTKGLAGRSPSFLGHDSTDNWRATKAIVKAAGLPDKWGWCETCKGTAIHPDDAKEQDEWEPTKPPEGDGYQLWETTSEGSPISPVFKTLDELCEWAAPNASVFGGIKTSAEDWKEMLSEGFVHHKEGGAIFI